MAPVDAVVVERHVRRPDRAGDHHLGLGEPRQVVGPPHRVGDDQRGRARPDGRPGRRAGGSWRCCGGMLRSITACSSPTSTPSSKVVEQDSALISPRMNCCWIAAASRVVPLRGVLHRRQRDGVHDAVDGAVVVAVLARLAAGRTARALPRSPAPGRRRGPRPGAVRRQTRALEHRDRRRSPRTAAAARGRPGGPTPRPCSVLDCSQSTRRVRAGEEVPDSRRGPRSGRPSEPRRGEHPAYVVDASVGAPGRAARTAPCGSASGPDSRTRIGPSRGAKISWLDGTSSGIVTAPCWRSVRTSSSRKAQASSSVRPRPSSGCGGCPGRVAVQRDA